MHSRFDMTVFNSSFNSAIWRLSPTLFSFLGNNTITHGNGSNSAFFTVLLRLIIVCALMLCRQPSITTWLQINDFFQLAAWTMSAPESHAAWNAFNYHVWYWNLHSMYYTFDELFGRVTSTPQRSQTFHFCCWFSLNLPQNILSLFVGLKIFSQE